MVEAQQGVKQRHTSGGSTAGRSWHAQQHAQHRQQLDARHMQMMSKQRDNSRARTWSVISSPALRTYSSSDRRKGRRARQH